MFSKTCFPVFVDKCFEAATVDSVRGVAENGRAAAGNPTALAARHSARRSLRHEFRTRLCRTGTVIAPGPSFPVAAIIRRTRRFRILKLRGVPKMLEGFARGLGYGVA